MRVRSAKTSTGIGMLGRFLGFGCREVHGRADLSSNSLIAVHVGMVAPEAKRRSRAIMEIRRASA